MSTDTNAFTNGPNGGVYGNANLTPSEGDKDDWQSMTWSQIEAAILGASEVSSSNTDTGAGTADPTSLQSAADVFYTVQQTLASVAEDMVQQAGLLAGQDGSPWTGAAAESFMAMIKTFANDINANVSLLQDAAGNSVPDQLINNANTLAWAQQEVQYIDSYWANIATQEGAQTINGLVQVHEVPSIPPLMTSDMKQVMSSLVTNYSQNTYPTPVSPQPVSPNGSTNINPNLNQNVPNYNFNGPNYGAPNYPNINMPNINIPNYAPPNYNTNIPNTDLTGSPNLNSNIPNTDLTGSPNLNSNIPTDDFATTGNPNLSGSPNLNDEGLDPAGLNGSPNLADTADDVNPADLAASPNLGLSPDEEDGLPDSSALNPAMDDALNPGLSSSPNLTSSDPLADEESLPDSADLASSPGLDTAADDSMPIMPGTGSGAGQALTSTDPSDASGLLNDTDPFSGDSPLTSDDLGSLSGASPGLTSAAGDESMPVMPGTGSGSGAGQALSSTDPSDASGLLSDTDPFSGESPLTSDELGSDTGTAPGLASDGETLGSDGMPFMPGTGSGAGAGQALGATDPSDASGLLERESAPWSEEGLPGEGEIGSLTGAAPGLAADGDPLAEEEATAPGESVGSDGMPFMPGMGSGAGAGQAQGATDPSDASGLLGKEGDPWAEPETTAGDEIGSADGAQAAASPEAESEPAEEMPIMPGTGAGQAADQHGDERSDASGLLAAETQPWTEGDEEHAEEIGAGAGAIAAAGEAGWLGAGAVLAAAAPAEQERASAPVEEPAAEPVSAEEVGATAAVAEGEEEYEYDGFDDEEEIGAGRDGDRVPVIGADGSDDDLSGWDLAGAAADAALFTLGAWANRRRPRDDDDETFARIVSTEEDAWIGEDADLPAADEEADGLPTASTWRPNRDFSGSGESRPMAAGTFMRSAPPPKDYDPVAAAEAAAAAAEAEEAERQAALEAEEEEKRKRAPADLLTQDRDMWGTPKTDWDAL